MKFDFQNNISRIQNLRNYEKYSFTYNPVMDGLSIVILNLDKPEFIVPLIEKLKESKREFEKENLFFEILIGDTGTNNKDVLELYSDPDVSVVYGLKYHFSKNNNEVAFHHSKSSHLLFMNNDMIFEDNKFLLNLYQSASGDQSVGIFGHVLLFENKTIQHRGIEFQAVRSGSDYMPYHIDATKKVEDLQIPSEKEYNSTTGAFLLIQRELFAEINGFNEDYEKEAQDIDLCLKVRRLGYGIKVLNLAEVFHFENGTRVKGEESNFDRSLFVRLWSSFIEGLYLA